MRDAARTQAARTQVLTTARPGRASHRLGRHPREPEAAAPPPTLIPGRCAKALQRSPPGVIRDAAKVWSSQANAKPQRQARIADHKPARAGATAPG